MGRLVKNGNKLTTMTQQTYKNYKTKDNMKQRTKHSSLLSGIKLLGLVLSLSLALASCTKDDVAQNPTKPNEETNKNLTTFVAGGENKTRTSLDYNSGNFYWEANDYIYVKDDDGVLRKSTNAPTSKVAAFKYKVPGKFTASSSYKVYYLGKNSSGNDVTISTQQSQTAPDNTEHFGTAGDYGTATATGTLGGGSFSFQLEHQPAYLVFQPYTSNTVLQNCYLTKVEVSSDNDIAETYTVNATTGALDASAVTGGKKIVLTTKGGSNPNGFPLTNSAASVTTNGAYMVIKPGTHILKVRYWVKDVTTNVEGAITKTLPATAYASNTYYDMTANLNVRDYDVTKYYMWDAQQNYWAGHEWNTANPWQPVLNGQSNSNYAKNNSDPRYYNEAFTYGADNKATHTPCKDLPNVNEMTWYAAKGDPRWDDDELWTTMGHLYKGGMWFKKKSVLQAEGNYNSNTAVDGTDWRTNRNYSTWSVSQTLPSAADANKYFYLPALGFYDNGQLYVVGFLGYYFSSSATPDDALSPYFLQFYSGYVRVATIARVNGLWSGGFE